MTHRLVFVLGTGRCGSTLVHELLARHTDVGWVSNIDDLVARAQLSGRWNGPLFRALPPAFATKGRVRFAPSEGYRSLRLQVSPLIVAPYRDLLSSDVTPWLAERLRAYFQRRAAAQRTPVFLHKFAGWPRARLLHKVFPDARFVHVYRDGRAVANSFMQAPWWPGFGGAATWPYGPLPLAPPGTHDSFVGLSGLAWATLIDAFAATADAIPRDRWLEVRYEDLVRSPRAGMREVLSFCGLEWDGPYESSFSRLTFSMRRTEAFRTDLDPESLALLDDMLRSRLSRLGYS